MSELKAKKILEYWYNKEYFSPFYPKRKRGDIVLYGSMQQNLPWNFGRENEMFNVYIGKISIDNLVTKLHKAMKLEESAEREKSVTCIGKIKVNQKGEYIKESFKISPFLFAVTSLINAETFDIVINEEAIDNFNKRIDSMLEGRFSEINTKDRLVSLERMILRELRYSSEDNFSCIIKISENQGEKSSADAEDMFESFFAKDLLEVSSNLESNDKIIEYITAKEHNDKQKIMIDRDIEEMKKWIFPDKYPLGKWPSKYSPSLMQQIAINIAISDKDEATDIFSVNGPPGTGKTTLLKEVIASNIVSRAAELSKYENLDNVLKMCRVKNPPDDFHKTYYEFPSELEKYSIIVASNNNAAVENISLDLPDASDVQEEKTHTGRFDVNKLGEVYFSDVAGKLIGKKAWGLISAPLGNLANVKEVKNALNTNKSHLFGNYFNDESKKIDWNTARKEFIEQYNLVKCYQEKIVSDVNLLYSLNGMKEEADRLELEQAGLRKVLEEKVQVLDNLASVEKRNLEETKTMEESIEDFENSLSFFKKILLKIFKNSVEKQKLDELNKTKERLLSEYSGMQVLKANTLEEHSKISNELKDDEKRCADLRDEYSKALKEVENIKERYRTSTSENFADDEFFQSITSNNISQKACPWTNEEYDKLREELFFRALILQKAFVQNAKGVKQNIRMLCRAWENTGFFESDKKEFFKHVFNTLFLVIPVISTTFASVGNLLKYIGKNELGTLIVDEAGQANPASAVGALWRTRKAIVVGDPLQVEPVVTASKDLSRIFINRLGIDPDYGRADLSVQEFADLVNPFNGEINGVSVGCPLVVHRRCITPMFDISNSISYGNRMFNETVAPKEKIKFSIANSRWIHCKGAENGNKDHYVKEQGEEVVKLVLNAFKVYGPSMFEVGAKMIYIISPFISVVNCIRARLKEEFSLNKTFSVIDIKYFEKWLENSIGTVHKFQGKEANEVVFVLGCDENSGKMAANWAGSKANILNVAVTRAKYRFVAIGDAELWGNIQYFSEAVKILKDNYELVKFLKSN